MLRAQKSALVGAALMLFGLVSCSAHLDLGRDPPAQPSLPVVRTAPESRTSALCGTAPCFAGNILDLATSEGSAKGLALDQDTLFWAASAGQALMTTSKDGTSTAKVVVPPGGPYGVAVDDTTVYFTGAGGGYVASMAKGSPKPVIGPKLNKISLLVSDEPNPQGVAVAAEGVYFANQDAGTLKRVSLDGKLVETVASGLSSGCDIALDEQFVYYSDSGLGEIHSIDRQTGASKLLASALQHPRAPFPRGQFLYFLESGTENASYADGRLSRMARGGGTIEVLLEKLAEPRALAADPVAVYVAIRGTTLKNSSGKIARFSDDGQASTLATDQAEPFAVVVDDTAVYWTTDADNGLHALAR